MAQARLGGNQNAWLHFILRLSRKAFSFKDIAGSVLMWEGISVSFWLFCKYSVRCLTLFPCQITFCFLEGWAVPLLSLKVRIYPSLAQRSIHICSIFSSLGKSWACRFHDNTLLESHLVQSDLPGTTSYELVVFLLRITFRCTQSMQALDPGLWCAYVGRDVSEIVK